MNVFLDLEETVIDDWFSGMFLGEKIAKIKHSLDILSKDTQITSLNIFSFAIVDENDVRRFNTVFRQPIENIFEMPINNVIMMSNDFINELLKPHNTFLFDGESVEDVFTVNSKMQSFELFCKANHAGEKSVLFDDMVENVSISHFLGEPFISDSTDIIMMKI